MPTRTQLTHTVAGLHVVEWPGSGPTVVGLPGLSSSSAAWAPLARALPDARVIAPDLRGRGASQRLAGPTGLRAHARDVKAILEELDLRDVVVIGHSMGAFLAPVVAQESPDRVARLVMVDGGIRPALPFVMTPGVTRLVFRKKLGKLDRDWPDAETMIRASRADKMLTSRPDLIPVVTEMLGAELGGAPGALRPRLDVERAAADAADTFHGTDAREALEALTIPAVVLLAEHKEKDGQKPFISDAVVAPWTRRLPNLTVKRLPGNHVTVLFDPEVARAVTG